MNHRKRRGGDRQLRGNLGPVLQSSDEGSSRKLVGDDDLITGVQPDAFELRSGEKTVDVVRGYHHPVRAQYKSVVQVRLRFSFARYFEICAGGIARLIDERAGILHISHH